MIFGTVCSGIGAPELAWKPLGWRCAFMSEIEPFPRAVLAHHHPETPLHGDFTTIQAGDYAGIDLLCGGTPCQSFSVAGLRGGLADERGNLALEYLRLADRLRPRWVVWENVPGVLSSNGGRDFGALLGGLGELGYGFAYRSLDAQHFGLAQRRLRVFVVGYLGDWRPAAAVLFEPASLRGHPAPRREAGERVARPIAAGSPGGSGYRNDADTADSLIAGTFDTSPTLRAQSQSSHRADIEAFVPVAFGGNNTAGPIDVATALNASHTASGRQDFETETFIAHTPRAGGFDASEDGTGRGVPLVAASLTSGKGNGGNPAGRRQEDDTNLVPFSFSAEMSEPSWAVDLSETLKTTCPPAITGVAVRRLTPRECERLQGFPDDYTLIPYRKGVAADGPRYRALGNSMAVPVMAWIGRRIAFVADARVLEVS
jgi:DNA (cytosine-5)-methyltransferase 1